MAKISSDLIYLQVGGSTIACGRSNSHSRSLNYIDTTCQDSGGHQTGIGGLLSGSTSFEGLVSDTGADYTYSDLKAVQKAKTIVTLKYGGIASGQAYEQVDAIITSMEQSGGEPEGVTSFTAEFTHTGTETVATVV